MSIVNPIDKMQVMYNQYTRLRPALQEKKDMIDGDIDYGISYSIPASLRNALKRRSGLASSILDIMSSRIVFLGYSQPDNVDLDIVKIMDYSDFDATAGALIYDALSYGVGFCLIGKDENDDWYFLPVSPLNVYAEFSPVNRQVTSAIIVNGSERITLYTSDMVYVFSHDEDSKNGWFLESEYSVNACPLVAVFNSNTSSQFGKSELSAGVRDAICGFHRTELSMTVSEEMYSSLDATILGGDPRLLRDENGRPTNLFSSMMGRTRQITQPIVNERTGELGSIPHLEFAPRVDPKPFIASLDHTLVHLGMLVGIPPHRLVPTTGLGSESFKLMDQTLVTRTQDRIKTMRKGFKNIALKMFMLEYGYVPDEAKEISVRFENPEALTFSSAADGVFKMIEKGVFQADSEIAWNRLSLSADEQEILRREQSSKKARSVLESMRSARTNAVKDDDTGAE